MKYKEWSFHVVGWFFKEPALNSPGSKPFSRVFFPSLPKIYKHNLRHFLLQDRGEYLYFWITADRGRCEQLPLTVATIINLCISPWMLSDMHVCVCAPL